MPGNQINQSNKPYLRIIGGNLVQEVNKTTPGARLREYELPQKGSKWELVYMNWTGRIESIRFKDTEFGTLCLIDMGDAILSINIESRYFQDFACKIYGADLAKEVTLHPYDIKDDEKRKIGISVQQEGIKLKNVFYNWETKERLHGFPAVDETMKEKLKKNYWKVYFAEVAAFLISKLETLKFLENTKTEPLEEEEILIEDLPF